VEKVIDANLATMGQLVPALPVELIGNKLPIEIEVTGSVWT
jgi:hypothetical protein